MNAPSLDIVEINVPYGAVSLEGRALTLALLPTTSVATATYQGESVRDVEQVALRVTAPDDAQFIVSGMKDPAGEFTLHYRGRNLTEALTAATTAMTAIESRGLRRVSGAGQ